MLHFEQEAARMASMEDQDDEVGENSAGSDEKWDEPAEEMAWKFYELQGGNYRGVLAF